MASHSRSPAEIRGALKRAEGCSHLLDSAVRVPGTSRTVGLDPLISVLPVSGDAVAGVLSLYVVLEAWLSGVDELTLTRMLLNVCVDVVVGSIPLVGSVFDAVWKANERNVALFRRDVEGRYGEDVLP